MRLSGVFIYRRILVIAILLMMLFPALGTKMGSFIVQENLQPLAKPKQMWDGIVEHKWQSFLEQRFLIHMGDVRSFLLLLHNEVKKQLFPRRPSKDYVWTPELGYYPVDSIRRLNNDVSNYYNINQHYQRAAGRLRILQELLAKHGVTLLMVTPPPKARVYPEYIAPYLVSSPETIMSQAISYGTFLETNGVNFVDVQGIFSENKAFSKWPFFTATSFHWSYWAACGVTDEVLRKAQVLSGLSFLRIDCSDVDYGKSKWADNDIANALNVLATDALIGNAPFPKIFPHEVGVAESRKILVIGDSFSDHINYALTQAKSDNDWSPQWLTFYDSFVHSQTFGMGGKVTPKVQLQKASALSEILTKELLLMVVSDGNVHRSSEELDNMEFGATRALLDELLSKADSGEIDPKNFLVKGWHAGDSKQWQTSGHVASFAIRPPADGERMEISLDLENLAPDPKKIRLLDISLDGNSLGQVSITPGRRVVLPSTFFYKHQWNDPLVAEISIRDTLGNPLNLLLKSVLIAKPEQQKIAKSKFSNKKANPDTYQYPQKAATIRNIDMISNEESTDTLVTGLSGLESNGNENWRWGIGPATIVKFYIAPQPQEPTRKVLLKFGFKNGISIQDQSVTIRLNGEEIYQYSSAEINKKDLTDSKFLLKVKKGVNVLEFTYGDWNHGKKIYASHDPRKLSVVFLKLSLHSAEK